MRPIVDSELRHSRKGMLELFLDASLSLTTLRAAAQTLENHMQKLREKLIG